MERIHPDGYVFVKGTNFQLKVWEALLKRVGEYRWSSARKKKSIIGWEMAKDGGRNTFVPSRGLESKC
jgi:hypothetical protein